MYGEGTVHPIEYEKLMLNALWPHRDARYTCPMVTLTYDELNLAVCSPHAAFMYTFPYGSALGSVKKGFLHLRGPRAFCISHIVQFDDSARNAHRRRRRWDACRGAGLILHRGHIFSAAIKVAIFGIKWDLAAYVSLLFIACARAPGSGPRRRPVRRAPSRQAGRARSASPTRRPSGKVVQALKCCRNRPRPASSACQPLRVPPRRLRGAREGQLAVVRRARRRGLRSVSVAT